MAKYFCSIICSICLALEVEKREIRVAVQKPVVALDARLVERLLKCGACRGAAADDVLHLKRGQVTPALVVQHL